MEIIFDFLFEVVVEIFVEGFISLCSVFVPQKVITSKIKKIISYVCLVVSFLLLVGLLMGIAILGETKGQSFWGWLLISLNIIYLFTGIAFKIVSYIKKKK